MGIFYSNNSLVDREKYISHLKYSKYEKDNIYMRHSYNHLINGIVHIWRNWHIFWNSFY